MTTELLEASHPIAAAFAGVARDVARAQQCGAADHGAAGGAGSTAALWRLRVRRELRPLLAGVELHVRHDLSVPFRTLDGRNVELNAAVLADDGLAAVHLRHALELALLHRIRPGRDLCTRLTAGILACNVGLEYLDALPSAERRSFLEKAPAWLAALDAEAGPASGVAPARRIEAIAERREHLMPLQRLEGVPFRPDDVAHACAAAHDALPAAVPTARLLTLGGDNRLLVHPRTGLNKYGCSPKPRPEAITFSSCTASSSSDLAFDAAEKARQALLAGALSAPGFASHFARMMDELRGDLGRLLGFDSADGVEIVFSPSGTDVELYALHFALAGHRQPVLNILVAPKEIGSGSLPAAQGLQFSDVLPLGGVAKTGEPVRGLETDRVRLSCVEIRDPDTGAARDPEELDREVEALVEDAVARGEHVLLHLLDSSKTGMGAPSVATVRRLASRHRGQLSVLVDAAQMRLSIDQLASYLEAGFMVIVSGSKFYTGAPFSGALLVPRPMSRVVAKLSSLPQGFGDFLSRHDVSSALTPLRGGLPDVANVGLCLRWRSALWEMRAFAAVPEERRRRYFDSFARALAELLASCPHVETVDAPLLARRPADGPPSWDQIPTIFTFLVHREGHDPAARASGRTALSQEEAGRVYAWLNEDVSGALPPDASAEERALAARRCHIGQPVAVRKVDGRWLGALRIAPGARLVSRVHFDPLLGADPDDRLAQQVEDARTVLEKIGLILRRWEALAAMDVGAAIAEE